MTSCFSIAVLYALLAEINQIITHSPPNISPSPSLRANIHILKRKFMVLSSYDYTMLEGRKGYVCMLLTQKVLTCRMSEGMS